MSRRARPHTVVAGSRRAAALTAAAAFGWAARHAASPAVRGWTPATVGRVQQAGRLRVRATDDGDGDGAVVLLHGLTGSQVVWGGGYDALAGTRRLLVPDLLGFGGSMDAPTQQHDLAAHLAALDEVLAALDLEGRPLTVAGWSLGALLALHWGARRPETVRVVSLCAPLYTDPEQADERIRAMGALEALFALETPVARATCRLMCRYRAQAQWLSVALSPRWPVPVARSGVLHTWPSYIGAMNGIIRGSPWAAALETLDDRRVPVVLAEGARDEVPAPGLAVALAARYRCVTTAVHPSAAHDLPVADPAWCRELIAGG
jgi:pimeloyl-ACP methyl ester carboxylesterase